MSRVESSTGRRVRSPSSGLMHPADQSEVDRQGKSEGCSSDVQTDTDSYKTADDDDQHVSQELDDDPLTCTVPVQDSSELEFSSSSGEDDSHANANVSRHDSTVAGHHGELEKRRKSYQFAIAKSGGIIPDTNDDDVVCDLDPDEFRHQHVMTADRRDEGSDGHSEDALCDLDPREFSHPSVQPTRLLVPDSHFANHIRGTVEDDKSSDEQKQSDTAVFENEGHERSAEALSVIPKGHSQVCVTERHEAVVSGDLLSTIIVPSPAEKTSVVTDHQEWIVRQSSKRAVFDFSLVAEQLPSRTAASTFDDVRLNKLNDQISMSALCRHSPHDEKQFAARSSYSSKNEKPLPIAEALVYDTAEFIRTQLIETAPLWETFLDDTILSSSPEKESHYPFEENVPSPDYGSSMSSDTSSESGDDVAVDDDINSDTAACRTDRSPTPDYNNTLSPIREEGVEFHFDVSVHSKPEVSVEARRSFAGKMADDRIDETEIGNDVGECEGTGSQSSLARTGSQRFSKPVHIPRSALTPEPALAEQADEDKGVECEQKVADISETIKPTQPVALVQHGKTQELYRTGTESAPAVLPPNEKGVLWQSQSKQQIASGDQSTIYSTLGITSDRRRRTAGRSVVMSCLHYCSTVYTDAVLDSCCLLEFLNCLSGLTLSVPHFSDCGKIESTEAFSPILV